MIIGGVFAPINQHFKWSNKFVSYGHGGYRRGAGRKTASGIPKLTKEHEIQLAKRLREEIRATAHHDISFEGDDILSFFVAIARNKDLGLGVRMDAARAAAPYLLVRRTATEITGRDGGPLLIEQIANAALAVVAAEREEEKRKQALH